MTASRSSGRQERFRLVERMRGEGRSWIEIAAVIGERYRVNPRVALRLAHGWTQQQVADAWNQRWPDEPKTFKAISKWEVWPAASGHPPPFEVLSRLAELYQCAVGDLVADQANFRHLDTAQQTRARAAARVEMTPLVGESTRTEVTAMNRRELTALLATLATTTPIGRLMEGVDQQIGQHDAVAVRQLVRHLDDLDDRFGGGSLCDVAMHCVRRVEDVLARSQHSETAGRDLQAAYGELVGYTGWLHFDACRHETAKTLFHEALCVAQLAEDRDLEIFVLASLSLRARYLGNPRAGVQFAQRARQRAQGLSTPRLDALLLSREAAGWAGLGDRGSFLRLSRTAQATFSEAVPEDPSWIAYLDVAELKVTEALSWHALGDTHNAEATLRSAIDEIPESKPRNQASYRMMLADVLASQGDIGGACDAANTALPKLNATSSGRAHERWDKAWISLRSHIGRPDVREVAAHAYDLGLVGSSATVAGR